jgi:hypothetical protein
MAAHRSPAGARRAVPAVPAVLLAAGLALGLSACGAAENAVQGAQDAASQKASEAVEGAKDKASAKASELAVAALKSQICNLVQDGALSDADAQALDGFVAAGKEAGLPAEILSVATKVADAGTGATDTQVSNLEAQTCTG